MRGPVEKKERSLGERLHLKGHRCDTPKCAAVRKPYRPGVHGPHGRRKALSDFGRQLFEKQKFKVVYGLDERALRRLFGIAEKSTRGTAMKLLELLERRLDNVIFRLGLGSSRSEARQLIVQGHIVVNGRRTRSPGYLVAKDDVVGIRSESKKLVRFQELPKAIQDYKSPLWLSLNKDTFEGKVVELPQNEAPPFEINLLVESFSK